jgi:hypothetical protein
LRVGDVLSAVSKAGLKLEAGETADVLKAYPAERLTAQLAAAIREHKADIIKVVREDEEMRRTGIIQSERQVFELAREFLGSNEKEGVE